MWFVFALLSLWLGHASGGDVIIQAPTLVTGAGVLAADPPSTEQQSFDERASTLVRLGDASSVDRQVRILLLSSLFGIDGTPFRALLRRLLEIPDDGDHQRVLVYVPTAALAPDHSLRGSVPPEERRRSRELARQRAEEMASSLGLEMRVLDVESHATKAEQQSASACEPGAQGVGCEITVPWADTLKGASGIYVAGGNTFYLMHALSRLPELANQLRKLVESGVVYIGQSAGAIVAGQSIRTAYWKGYDSPEVCETADWHAPGALDGLSLFDSAVVFPHYASNWQELVATRCKDLDLPCLTIRDNEAVLYSYDASSSSEHHTVSVMTSEGKWLSSLEETLVWRGTGE